MPPVSALYFPDLLPPPAAAVVLGRLFAPLRCYSIPAAASNSQPQPPLTLLDQLQEEGKLEFHQPLTPDQVDLPRLHTMLQELDGRSGQDAALFVQGVLSQLSDRRQESASELVGPLLGFSDDPATREEEETLWRALLVLKLAEIQERREQELEEELRRFEESSAALFRQLRGEEEAAGAVAPAMAKANSPRPGRNSAMLLRAWSRLFLRDRQGVDLLVSADPEAVALLLDCASTMGGREPRLLGPLFLPPAESPSISDQTLTGLALALHQVANRVSDHAAPHDRLQDKPCDWLHHSEAVAEAIAACNRELITRGEMTDMAVEFFLVPEIPLDALLARFGGRPQAAPGQKKGRGENPHGLIALLRQQGGTA